MSTQQRILKRLPEIRQKLINKIISAIPAKAQLVAKEVERRTKLTLPTPQRRTMAEYNAQRRADKEAKLAAKEAAKALKPPRTAAQMAATQRMQEAKRARTPKVPKMPLIPRLTLPPRAPIVEESFDSIWRRIPTPQYDEYGQYIPPNEWVREDWMASMDANKFALDYPYYPYTEEQRRYLGDIVSSHRRKSLFFPPEWEETPPTKRWEDIPTDLNMSIINGPVVSISGLRARDPDLSSTTTIKDTEVDMDYHSNVPNREPSIGRDYVKNTLNAQLPYNYPFYARPWAAISDTDVVLNVYDPIQRRNEPRPGLGPKVVVANKYHRVTSDEDRDYYIKLVIKWLFEENYDRQNPPSIDRVGVSVINSRGRQELITVARYKMGNCLLNIISGTIPKTTLASIYKKLPHLKPTTEVPNPVISKTDIVQVAKTARINFKIFSRVGALTNEVWEEIGQSKAKTFQVVFNDGHATIREQSIRVDSITYLDRLPNPTTEGFTDTVFTLYGDYARDEEPPLNGYIRLINGKSIMYKDFRPSSVTNNAADDSNTSYAYHTTPEQVLAKIFKDKHSITTIANETIRSIVRSAEHFIGRKRFTELDKTKEIDMNKCYVSYKSSPYYTGFPTTDLYPIAGEADNSLFFSCTVVDPPKAFEILMQYQPGTEIVLTRPVVCWLRHHNAQVNVVYSLVGKTTDIDIVEFADSYRDIVPPESLKLFRNSLIGRCINGGLKEAKKMTCKYTTEEEKYQLIYDAEKAGFTFSLAQYNEHGIRVDQQFTSDDPKYHCGYITIHYKSSPKGAFQFHSFILGYALTGVAEMMQQIINLGGTIAAYNVDAIVFKGSTPPHSNAQYGGWKVSPTLKSYYSQLTMGPLERVTRILPDTSKVTFKDFPVDTLITGAPGISKSYPFLAAPYHDQIFLTPRRELRDEHKATQQRLLGTTNVVTAHKYFQFTLSVEQWLNLRVQKRIPQAHKVLIIDEYGMFSSHEWDIMRRRAKLDGSTIIGLGDPCQIKNEIESTAVSEKWFIAEGFKTQVITRVEGQVARQSYTDGVILDSLRGKSPAEQVDLLAQSISLLRGSDDRFTTSAIDFSDSKHIAGSHKRCNEVNLLARDWFTANDQLFPCRDAKGKIIYMPTTDERIWWCRTEMKQTMPKQYKFEPAYSVTSDSTQGRTIRSRIYVDNNLCRHGAFYTAVSRCVSLSQVYIVTVPPVC